MLRELPSARQRTFDRGYKSSNLALMVELLAGPFVGAAHMNKRTAKNWGNLVMAFDPGMMGDAETFYRSAVSFGPRIPQKVVGTRDTDASLYTATRVPLLSECCKFLTNL